MNDEYEVVDVAEAGIDAEVPHGGSYAHGLPPIVDAETGLCAVCGEPVRYDAFGALVIPPVRVRDGVRDSEQR